jgi:hypothetical protein
MDDYALFFSEIWNDNAPLYATVFPLSTDKTKGVRVRVIEGLPRTEYAAERGVTLPVAARVLSLLAAELPETWRPVPGAMLTFRGHEWRIHQDVPPVALSPDGSLIRLTIHPI